MNRVQQNLGSEVWFQTRLAAFGGGLEKWEGVGEEGKEEEAPGGGVGRP